MTNEEILKGLYNAEFSTKEPEEPTMPIKMAMMVLGSYWTIVNKKDTIYDENFTGISIYA